MHRRHFFFLLFFLVSPNRLYGQGTPELATFLNNPFEETLHPVLALESGQLAVKLVNGFHETVSLTQLSVHQGAFKSGNVLKRPVDFCPADVKYIDLDTRGIDLRQDIRLVLRISPQPPRQRSEFLFRFDSRTSRMVEVESEPHP